MMAVARVVVAGVLLVTGKSKDEVEEGKGGEGGGVDEDKA